MSRKKLFRGRIIYVTFSFALILLVHNVFIAQADEYPTRPIKLIIPFSPGGVADLTWRAMTDPMGKSLGQPVVIENKPGGAGALGYTLIGTSRPDGYSIGHVSIGSFINNSLMYDVGYNPIKSFSFICGVSRYPESLVVKSSAPWKTWNEFVDFAKKHPNEVTLGYSGAASTNTIALKWITKRLGIKWKEVTFPGDAEGITALLGGHIDAFPGAGAQNLLVKDKRARMLLALTIDPIPGFPDVPTFKMVFGKDIMNASGLVGPAGIASPILMKLEKAVEESTKNPGFIKAIEQMNMTPLWRNGKDFGRDISTALENFQEFLRDLDLIKKK